MVVLRDRVKQLEQQIEQMKQVCLACRYFCFFSVRSAFFKFIQRSSCVHVCFSRSRRNAADPGIFFSTTYSPVMTTSRRRTTCAAEVTTHRAEGGPLLPRKGTSDAGTSPLLTSPVDNSATCEPDATLQRHLLSKPSDAESG